MCAGGCEEIRAVILRWDWTGVYHTTNWIIRSFFAAAWSHVVPDLCAVVMMASIISMMRCSAESAPTVMSVPQKSLSMEPTRPTMFRCVCCLASASVILPAVVRESHWAFTDGTRNNAAVTTSHQRCLQGFCQQRMKCFPLYRFMQREK